MTLYVACDEASYTRIYVRLYSQLSISDITVALLTQREHKPPK